VIAQGRDAHAVSQPRKCGGQDATTERLRIDRQLEEAMVKGPDPLHLAEVFGLDGKTAMRYADSARALLEQAAGAGPDGALWNSGIPRPLLSRSPVLLTSLPTLASLTGPRGKRGRTATGRLGRAFYEGHRELTGVTPTRW
jgi:hypothetical protein